MRILIFLSQKISWLIQHPSGQTECVVDGDLSQLHSKDDDAIGVIVPAHPILLTEAVLPRLSAYRLQKALPFALEEQVLDPLELLHFAHGPETAGALPVAIVKKEELEQWLLVLENQGIHPDWLSSAIFTVPYEEKQWQVQILDDTALVRTGLYAGFSTERANLDTLLNLKLQEEKQGAEKEVIYSAHLSAQHCLEQAALVLEKNPPLNLLQGPYASKRKFRILEKNKRAWLLASFGLALWLGLLFVGKIGSWFILSWEHHHLQSSISRIYRDQLPEAATLMNAKAQLEAKLKRTLAQSDKNRLFQWLGDLSKASTPLRLQSLSFQNKRLSLELIAPSFTALDDYILSLKSQELDVKQQSAVLTGNQVKAVLSFEGHTL